MSEEELSTLKIKLAKNKRNRKDWDQIKAIFSGKAIYTFQVEQPSTRIKCCGNVAEEDGMLTVFTSLDIIDAHLKALTGEGAIFGKVIILGLIFDEVIEFAEQRKKDIIFDPDSEQSGKYYMYSGSEHRLKAVIKAEEKFI